MNVWAQKCPGNEIWYTSTNRQIIPEFSNGKICKGLTLLSNTYEDGKGVAVFDSDVTSIGDMAFYSCEVLSTITLPNTVTSIGEFAFSHCIFVTDISIPNIVKAIGQCAFQLCGQLKEIALPEGLTSIENRTFYGCGSFAEITIPKSVTSIGNEAFSKCGPENIIIPDNVVSIGYNAFSHCSGMVSVTVPNSVISIGGNAFEGCNSLKEVNISDIKAWTQIDFSGPLANPLYEAHHLILNGTPLADVSLSDITMIKPHVFHGAWDLTSISIPNTVTSIGAAAFSGCKGLTQITIPESVTSIESEAFSKCESLRYIDIPPVSIFGSNMFTGCSNLDSIKVHWMRPMAIDGYTFNGVNQSKCTLLVPKGTYTCYKTTPNWMNFTNIVEYGDGDDIYLTIKQAEYGCLRQRLSSGAVCSFIIAPSEGWIVNSISFNGQDVTDQLRNEEFTTAPMTGNSELAVVFKEIGTDVKNVTKESDITVLVNDKTVSITGARSDESVDVYGMNGTLQKKARGNASFQLDGGNYVIKVGEDTFKVAL